MLPEAQILKGVELFAVCSLQYFILEQEHLVSVCVCVRVFMFACVYVYTRTHARVYVPACVYECVCVRER